MFFSSTKEITRFWKEKIDYLRKQMSNIYYLLINYYWKKACSKLRFPKFKKFISWSVFRELQLTQISLNFKTSCWNLKNRGLGAKLCVWLVFFVLFFHFKRNHDILKSMLLLNKNTNLNKNETESKMENPTRSFRKMIHVFQLV